MTIPEENTNKVNIEKALKHLNEKWGTRPCAQCGTNRWNVSDKVFELREFHGGNMIIGNSPIIPVLPVNCVNCGNTILINALIAGVIENPNQTNNPE